MQGPRGVVIPVQVGRRIPAVRLGDLPGHRRKGEIAAERQAGGRVRIPRVGGFDPPAHLALDIGQQPFDPLFVGRQVIQEPRKQSPLVGIVADDQRDRVHLPLGHRHHRIQRQVVPVHGGADPE